MEGGNSLKQHCGMPVSTESFFYRCSRKWFLPLLVLKMELVSHHIHIGCFLQFLMETAVA